MIEVLSRLRLPIAPVLPDEVARLEDIFEGESVNYSLDPKNTLVKWIDGQPVWRRVFILMSGATANVNHMILDIPTGWDFDGLVRLDGYLTTAAGVRVPLGSWFSTTDYFSCRITQDGEIIERHGGADMNLRPIIMIVDYISMPSGSSSWDSGITAWDGGSSTWDQV